MPITRVQGQMNRWVEYIDKLLNRLALLNPPDIEAPRIDIHIDVTLLKIEIISMAIREIKSRKVDIIPDIIPAEALRSDIEVTANVFHVLFTVIWESGQVPTTLKEEYLIRMPRKEDLRK